MQPTASARSNGSAFGPLRTFGLRSGARPRCTRAGRSALPRRLPLRSSSPALLGLLARRRTHFAHCVRAVRTSSTSQCLKRAARAATSPALLGASHARCGLPGHTSAAASLVFVDKNHRVLARQAVPGGGEVWGGEERRFGVGARSALRGLTCRICSNGANAVSKVSYAAQPQTEHHSEVEAKRRPPHPEPLPGAACRAARCRPASGHS